VLQTHTTELERIYRQALYQVAARNHCFTLRPDEHSRELAALMQQHGACCAAFLTACNPGSTLRSKLRNRGAQQRLLQALEQTSCLVLAGRGHDPAGQWPDEPSVLVLDLPRATACRTARLFGQLALLWADRRAVPHLTWVAGSTGFRAAAPASRRPGTRTAPDRPKRR
jgi:hypothetical protein